METTGPPSPRARAHSNGRSKHFRTLSCDDLRSKNISSPTLSSRQSFQARIRNLGSESIHTENESPSEEATNYSPQHVSGTATTKPQKGKPPPLNFRHSVDNPYSNHTSQELDFVLEERAAWNQLSPNYSQAQPGLYRLFPKHRTNYPHNDLVYVPSKENGSSLPEPASLLKTFAPLPKDTMDDERPKTSRGLQAEQSDSSVMTRTKMQSPVQTSPQKSKFNEGSMSDRSTAVASTWDETASFRSEASGCDTTDTDSDETPKVSRLTRDSGSSFDLTDFNPQSSSTSATIKKRFSRLANTFKASEEPKQEASEKKPKSKKRLRKSISTWSLHSIGEKMKMFGSSAQEELSAENGSPEKTDPEVDVLNERKRKANEAYAEQCGFKKQKPNSALSANPQEVFASYNAATVKKHSSSTSRTIKAPSTTQSRQDLLTQTSFDIVDPADLLPEKDPDHYKRPTRRELEKENQQLRAMLRERQTHAQPSTRQMPKSALMSTLHLPLEQPEIHTYIFNDPIKKTAEVFPADDIPPVPPLPSRAVLGELVNSRNYAKDTSTVKRIGIVIPRPVSTILEADEGSDKQCLDPSITQKSNMKAQAQWEWPDDIF